MDLTELLPDSYRLTADLAAETVLAHPDMMVQLMALCAGQQHTMQLRASRLLYIIGELNPAVLLPYWAQIVDFACTSSHQSVARNCLKTVHESADWVLREYADKLAVACMDRLDNPVQDVAVHALALKNLIRLQTFRPELREAVALYSQLYVSSANHALAAVAREASRKLKAGR